MKRIVSIAAAGSLVLALGACGGHKTDEAPVETNVANVIEVDNGMAVINEVAPPPAPVANATHPATARNSDFTDGPQTQDDADATGMTARVSRDEDNTSAPTH